MKLQPIQRTLLLPLFLLLSAGGSVLFGQSSDDILWIKGGHKGAVIAAAQSPDGRYIASAEPGGRTVVWERNSGNQAQAIGHDAGEDWVTLAFLPDSKTLAITAREDVVFYDVVSGKERGRAGLSDTATIGLFALADTTLLAVHASGRVELIDPFAEHILNSFQLPDTGIAAPKLIDNGSILLYVNRGDTLKEWDMKGGGLLSFSSPLDYREQFAGASDAPLIVRTDGSYVTLFNARTADTLFSDLFASPLSDPFSIGISASGDTLLLNWGRGARYLMESRTGKILDTITDGSRLFQGGLNEFYHRTRDAGLVEFSPAGDALLLRPFEPYTFASSGYRFWLYHLDTKTTVEYIAHTAAVNNVAISPEGDGAVTGSGTLLDFPSGRFRFSDPSITNYSRDGKTFIWEYIDSEAGLSGKVGIFSVERASWTAWDHYSQIPWPHYVPPGGGYALIGDELYFADSTYAQRKKIAPSFRDARFAWDGYHFAAWSADTIFIWDCRSVGIVSRIPVAAPPTAVEFSKDNSRIAVGYGDGHIDICETFSGIYLMGLDGHHGRVNDLSFSRRNRFLVSAGSDSTVRTWKLETGENDYTYRRTAPQLSVSTSSDGRYILSGGEDLTAICWIGRGEISGVEEEAANSEEELIALIIPNPAAKDVARIHCAVPFGGELRIAVVRADGGTIFQKSERVEEGILEVNLPVDHFPAGSYYAFLRLVPADGSAVRTAFLPLNLQR